MLFMLWVMVLLIVKCEGGSISVDGAAAMNVTSVETAVVGDNVDYVQESGGWTKTNPFTSGVIDMVASDTLIIVFFTDVDLANSDITITNATTGLKTAIVPTTGSKCLYIQIPSGATFIVSGALKMTDGSVIIITNLMFKV